MFSRLESQVKIYDIMLFVKLGKGGCYEQIKSKQSTLGLPSVRLLIRSHKKVKRYIGGSSSLKIFAWQKLCFSLGEHRSGGTIYFQGPNLSYIHIHIQLLFIKKVQGQIISNVQFRTQFWSPRWKFADTSDPLPGAVWDEHWPPHTKQRQEDAGVASLAVTFEYTSGMGCGLQSYCFC